MAWDNKTRPNKTAKIPYAYKADAEDPLVLVPDPDMVKSDEATQFRYPPPQYIVHSSKKRRLKQDVVCKFLYTICTQNIDVDLAILTLSCLE
jgi:hypothetical protein